MIVESREKEKEKTQLLALHQHGFGLINVIKFGVKHPKLNELKMRLMLEMQKKMLKHLKLEGLVGHLVWI